MDANKIRTHQTDELKSVLVGVAQVTLPHNVINTVIAKDFFLSGWSGAVVYDTGAKVCAVVVGEVGAVGSGSSHRGGEVMEYKCRG